VRELIFTLTNDTAFEVLIFVTR